MSSIQLKYFKKFELHPKIFDTIDNYELFLMPNFIYRTKKIICNNYLYPIYYFKINDIYFISTSVYSLITYKQKYERYYKYNNNDFYIPTFRTIDKNIKRYRTIKRTTDNSIKDQNEIAKIGAELIQNYVTEIEKKYPDHVNLLFMGGKDSQNIILTERKNKWVVLTSSPMDVINKNFIKNNNIKIEDFITINDLTNNDLLIDEIIAVDCTIDISHLRWVNDISKLYKKFNKKIIIWFGSNGDGVFTYNNNSRDIDHYAVCDLHCGPFIGTQHQAYKNIFNVPVISPYQSPEMLDKLFFKYDLYALDRNIDLRKIIGNIIFNKEVTYPTENLTPAPYKRKKINIIKIYENFLIKEKIFIKQNKISSFLYNYYNLISVKIDKYSSKKRGKISYIFFNIRKFLSIFFKYFENNRFDIKKRELK